MGQINFKVASVEDDPLARRHSLSGYLFEYQPLTFKNFKQKCLRYLGHHYDRRDNLILNLHPSLWTLTCDVDRTSGMRKDLSDKRFADDDLVPLTSFWTLYPHDGAIEYIG